MYIEYIEHIEYILWYKRTGVTKDTMTPKK